MNVRVWGPGNLVSFIVAEPEGRMMDVKSCVDELNRREREILERIEALESRLPLDRKPGEGGEKCAACEHRKSHSTPYRCEECTDCTCKPPRAESTGKDSIEPAEGGLYDKYQVKRRYDPTGKHAECEYFVLDWKHDPFAIPAARAYADACEEKYPDLAADLRARADASERPKQPRVIEHVEYGLKAAIDSIGKNNPAPAESSEWTTLDQLSPGDVFEDRAGIRSFVCAVPGENIAVVSQRYSYGTASMRSDLSVRRLHVFRADEATIRAVAHIVGGMWHQMTPEESARHRALMILDALRGGVK